MFGPFHLVVLDVAQEHEALLPLGLGHGEHLLLKFLLMAPMLRLYCCVMADMSTNSNLNYTYKINMLIDSFANINLRIGIIHVSFIHFSSRRRILLIMMFPRIFSNCLVIASMLLLVTVHHHDTTLDNIRKDI